MSTALESGGISDEAIGRAIRFKERFDLTPQWFVSTARFFQVSRPLGVRELARRGDVAAWVRKQILEKK